MEKSSKESRRKCIKSNSWENIGEFQQLRKKPLTVKTHKLIDYEIRK